MESEDLLALEQRLLRERDECDRLEQEIRSLAGSFGSSAGTRVKEKDWSDNNVPPLPTNPPPAPPTDVPEVALDLSTLRPVSKASALQFRSPLYRSASPARGASAVATNAERVVISGWGRSSRFPDPARNEVPGPGKIGHPLPQSHDYRSL